MTVPVISLLESLAESFCASAAGSGSAIRDFLMDYEKLLQRAGAHDGDARELAEAALCIWEAESDGRLRVERDRVTRRGLRVRLRQQGGEDWLFGRLGRDSPSLVRASLVRFFTEAAAAAVPDRWQTTWENWFLSLAAKASMGVPVPPFRRADPQGNTQLLNALIGVLSWGEPTTIRYASAALLGDSKLLQSLETRIGMALEAITGDASLEARGIFPKPRRVGVYGPLRIGDADACIDLGRFSAPIWLAEGNLLTATALHSEAQLCLTVENEDVFFELAKARADILLVSTSYPGAGTRHLLHLLPSSLPVYHFGDSDPAGFDILRDLREKSGRVILPVLMNFRPNPNAVPLSEEELSICHRLLEYSLMEDVAPALVAMLQSGTKGDYEQESLPLRRVLDELDRLCKLA